MQDKALFESLKSKITLVFKDPKVEEAFQDDKKIDNFILVRRLFSFMIALATLAMLYVIFIEKEKENKYLKEANQEEKEENHTYKSPYGWTIYCDPILIGMCIIELLIPCCPTSIHKFRGLGIILIQYIFITEPFVHQFSGLLDELVFGSASIAAVLGCIIEGSFITSWWITASIANSLGVLFSFIRFATSTQVPIMQILLLMLFLLIIPPLIFHSVELLFRKHFFLFLKYKKKDGEWRRLLNLIPTGIIICKEEETIFKNNSACRIFDFDSGSEEEDSRRMGEGNEGSEQIECNKDSITDRKLAIEEIGEKIVGEGEIGVQILPIDPQIEQPTHHKQEELTMGISHIHNTNTPNLSIIPNNPTNIPELSSPELFQSCESPGNINVVGTPNDSQELNIENRKEKSLRDFVHQTKQGFDQGRKFGIVYEKEINSQQIYPDQIIKKKYIQMCGIDIEFSERGCLAIILNDQTSQKNIEIERMRIVKGKELFFASMSHKLRNPLNALLGCLEIMKDSINEGNKDIFEIAKICGETLYNLIGNILDISKIESKKLIIRIEPGNLKDTMSRVITMSRSMSSQKGLFLKLEWECPIPIHLLFDHARLTQVLLNLISNSIKFTDKGGIVVRVQWYSVPLIESSPVELSPIELSPTHSPKSELRGKLPFGLGVEDPLFLQLLGNSNLREYVETVTEARPKSPRNYQNLHIFKHRASTLLDLGESPLGRDHRGTIEESSLIEEEKMGAHNVENFGISKEYSRIITEESIVQKKPEDSPYDYMQGYLKIQIIDSGCGINNWEVDQLFEPFIQASHSTSYGGTGLGLWISKQIVQLMHGDIRIDSSKGNGSNFIIVLPMKVHLMARFSKIISVHKTQKEISPCYKGLRCLFVEDDEYNRKIVKEMLERAGLIVFTAQNGLEGLNSFKESLEDGRMDMILTDLRMPVMSGQEMITKIRKMEGESKNLGSIPIIILSGEPSEIEINHCIQNLKANAFLNKPINIGKLLELMQNILGESESLLPHSSRVSEREEEIKKFVFIVDDDFFSAQMLSKMLENNGFYTLHAHNISEGMKMLVDIYDKIGVILMDNQLPDGRGSQFSTQIRCYEAEAGNKGQVPICSISGDDLEKQMEDYKDLEIDHFMQKPVNLEQIVQLAQNYII